MKSNSCPFCDIKDEKERVIKEVNTAFVILSDPRLLPGHMLVIPKRHVESFAELTDEEKREIFALLVEFEQKILQAIAPGCDIRQHYRPFQVQDRLKVDHLHFHLLPRTFEDELYKKSQIFEKDLFAPLTEEEKNNIMSLLAS